MLSIESCSCFDHSNLGHSDLFRISCFEFRISCFEFKIICPPSLTQSRVLRARIFTMSTKEGVAMCDIDVFVLTGGVEEKIMENVDRVERIDDELTLQNIFGEQQRIKGRMLFYDNSGKKMVFELQL